MSGYFDISPEIAPEIAVFPGDTPYRRTVLQDFSRGNSLVLSKIETTVHLGAHADAPSHYHPKGQAIAERSLELYYGDCQVVTVAVPRRGRIEPDHLDVLIGAPRVLLRTNSFVDYNRWRDDFNAPSPALIHWLAEQNVVLLGIDTPSMDISDDPVLHSHQAIARHDMAVLEGLVLHHVPDGIYHLCALPLRLRDADASPVRAVLWKK